MAVGRDVLIAPPGYCAGVMAVGRDGRPPGLPDRAQRCDARPAATRRAFQVPRRADRTQTERSDELGQEVGLLLPTHKQKPESGQLQKTPSGNGRGLCHRWTVETPESRRFSRPEPQIQRLRNPTATIPRSPPCEMPHFGSISSAMVRLLLQTTVTCLPKLNATTTVALSLGRHVGKLQKDYLFFYRGGYDIIFLIEKI